MQMESGGEVFDFRCGNCNKLLARHIVDRAIIELKCLRCGKKSSVLDASFRQIFLTDRGGKIIYVNEQVALITGYSPKEVLGKTPAIWGKLMPDTFYQKLWKTILDEKKATAFKITNRKKNGQIYEAVCKISPILNDDGEVAYFLGIQTVLPEQESENYAASTNSGL